LEHFAEREVNEYSYGNDNGDSKAIMKIGRLLRKDGIAIITIPFHEKGRANEVAYAHGSLFERWYTEQDLQERIIDPSGLKLVKKEIMPFLACLVLKKEDIDNGESIKEDISAKNFAVTRIGKKGGKHALRICLCSREYPPETAWGGIGTYTHELAHGLARVGQEVHVICQGLENEWEYTEDGVRVHRITHKPVFPLKGEFREFGLRWEYSNSVYQKLKEVIDKYRIDIVEIPNLSAEGFIYSFHKKTPLVTRLHTHFSEVIQFFNWERSWDRRLSCWLENAAILRSDLITCSTKAHAELVSRELGIDTRKIRIIPLGISIPELKEQEERQRPPTVLFVGRLEKRKGVHTLIQAVPYVLEKIPDARFVIVGRDSFISEETVEFKDGRGSSYKEQLLKLIPPSLQERVEFTGYLPPEELKRQYQACDIFVAPSLYESFGFIYLEAMSYAKPVIGCGVGGVPEVIDDKKTGVLVPPQDHGRLAEAITAFLKDHSQRLKMGNAARREVERRFNSDLMVKNTLIQYQQVCSLTSR
jgi:glycosyltransferase involved in cell wall biosynthesis